MVLWKGRQWVATCVRDEADALAQDDSGFTDGCLFVSTNAADVVAGCAPTGLKDGTASPYHGLHSSPVVGEAATILSFNKRGKMSSTGLGEQIMLKHSGAAACAAGDSGVRGKFTSGGDSFFTTHSGRSADGARAVSLRNGTTPHWLLTEAKPTEGTLLRKLHQRLFPAPGVAYRGKKLDPGRRRCPHRRRGSAPSDRLVKGRADFPVPGGS